MTISNRSTRLGLLALVSFIITGCSSLGIGDRVKDLAVSKPDTIGKQPTHIQLTKKDLLLNGPVKKAQFTFLRLGISGGEETTNVTFEFDKMGRVSKVYGSDRALNRFGMLKFLEATNHSHYKYASHGSIKTIKSHNKDTRKAFSARPVLFGEKTGNLRSIAYERTENKDTNSERNYRALEHMVYMGNRYLMITKRNDEPEEVKAKVIVTLNKKLVQEYELPNDDFDIKKAAIKDVTRAPTRHGFKLIRQQRFDRLGRLIERTTQKQGGQYTTRDSIRYTLKNNAPEQITTRDHTGKEKRHVRFTAYQFDAQGNWTARTSIISSQGSERQSNDKRSIEYYD